MNYIETEELEKLKVASKSLVNAMKSFENTIKNVFYNHFDFLSSLVYYISHKVEHTENLEVKFEKYMERFKCFCKKYSKFIIFEKFSLNLFKEGKKALNQNIEFVCNYEENGTFIDRGDIYKVVEINNKYGRCVKVRLSITSKQNQEFKEVKNDAKELKERLDNDIKDSKELEPLVNSLFEFSKNYRTRQHRDELLAFGINIQKKHLKYKKMYLYKCVLKQQSNFVYEEIENKAKDCAVCLEEFKNGANVTKLKCEHLFCSECIEKWLSNSTTCPCCRQNPEL